MRKHLVLFIFLLCLVQSAWAQKAIVEGYAFETDNRGYLREVSITVYSANNAIKAETVSNAEGFFTFEVTPGENYKVKASKSIFEETFVNIKADELKSGEKHYIKIEMPRKPGYLFDVTLSESFYGMDGSKNGIDSALIEIYNNTTNEEVMVLEGHPNPNFTYTFEQGNHYTVMVRKKGYFNKRMEAHVNIDGCILCFEGMGQVRPSDNLTEGNSMGSLIANVELDKIRLSQGIKVENIYYDYNKADIRPDAAIELDKIVAMMKDNPGLIIELGSHTDARGADDYNMQLSERRAKSAVAYIMRKGSIPATRIKARGYGESQIANRCSNNVNCSDTEHEENRRTMIKVVGFTETDPYDGMSLRDIIYEENLENAAWSDFESVEYVEGGELPDEIKRDLERQKEREEARRNGQKPEASTAVAATPAPQPSTPKVTTKPAAQKVPETPVERATIVEETKVQKEKVAPTTPKTKEPQIDAQVTIVPSKKQLRKPNTNRKNDDEFAAKGDEKKGAFGEKVIQPTAKPPIEKATVSNYLGAKPISEDYTGFLIEFFNSNIELSPQHSIFKQYGQVKMEKKSSGEYGYMIGGFNSRKEAESYRVKILEVRFPASKVVQYINGQRAEE